MNSKVKAVTLSSVTAALYIAISLIFAPVSFGPVQFRFAEALTVLCCFSPYYIVGLTVGCFIVNIIGPFGIVDAVVGGVATLVSAVLVYYFRKKQIKGIPLVSLIFPVIINALAVGTEIYFTLSNTNLPFILTVLSVALGEAVSVFVLGIPLYFAVKKIKIH